MGIDNREGFPPPLKLTNKGRAIFLKKLILTLIILIFLCSNQIIFAEDEIYNKTDEEGNVILFPFKSIVVGQTVNGADVRLDNFQQKANNKGEFEFLNLDEGRYILRINKEGFKEFVNEIDVGKGTVVDLGVINLNKDTFYKENEDIENDIKEDNINITEIDNISNIANNNDSINIDSEDNKNINSDTVDITDPNYLESIGLEDSKDKTTWNRDKFSVGNSSLDLKFAYLFINYNKNIKNGGSINSAFESNGFLTELTYKYPFNLYGHNLFLGINSAFITGVNDIEKVYDNDILDSTLLVDLSSKSIGAELAYVFDIDVLGDVYVLLGRSYDMLDMGVSSFELSENPELFTKEYRFSKGWTFGAGLDTDFSNLGFVNSTSFFNNLSAGLSFNYTPTLTDITSTKEFASMLVEGYKTDFDIYLNLNTKYQITLGYRYLHHYNNEKIDGLLTFPNLNSTFHGPYFRFDIPF